MTAADPGAAGAASDASPSGRQEAVRGLERALGDLVGEFRRLYVQAAESVSPGMLPGTYKVLSHIRRAGSVTASSIAERMAADKGQVSRAVSELEELGLVARTVDPHDGRIKLITVTEEGESRLTRAMAPYEGRLSEVLDEWPVESIQRFTVMLNALTRGWSPMD